MQIEVVTPGSKALAWGAAGLLGIAVLAYVGNLITQRHTAERIRANARTGHVVRISPNRASCQGYRFDNETGELVDARDMDCEDALSGDSHAREQ
jgi:hypothetical protein